MAIFCRCGLGHGTGVDRFLARISVASRLFSIPVCLLYGGRKYGYLVPNDGGRKLHLYLVNRDGYDPLTVQDQHSYLKALNNCSYLLDRCLSIGRGAPTAMHVRSYLDPRYLRLSIASVMPPLTEFYQPLSCRVQVGRNAWVESPRIGHAGVHDKEDLVAWRSEMESRSCSEGSP